MEEFIEEVRKYEFLYNLRNIDYRDQRKRQEAWEKIGEKINKNWQECRDSWTKLRNAYTNALKRRKTTNGQAEKKIMKWKFEDQLSFLTPYLEPRTSQGSLHSQIELKVETQSTDSDKNMTDYIETPDEEDDAEDSEGHDKPKFCSFSRTSMSKKRIEKSMTELVDIMKSNNCMRSQMRPPEVESSDDIDLFFLSLAKTVKKLPQNEQVRLKMGVSNLVFEAELRSIPPVTQSVTMPHSSPTLCCTKSE